MATRRAFRTPSPSDSTPNHHPIPTPTPTPTPNPTPNLTPNLNPDPNLTPNLTRYTEGEEREAAEKAALEDPGTMELEQSEALLQTEEHLLLLTTAQLEVTARGWK